MFFDIGKESCFILVDDGICFIVMTDKTIKVIKGTMKSIICNRELPDNYVRINRNIFINTLHFTRVVDRRCRLILMKTGNILKVSRSNWNNFKG